MPRYTPADLLESPRFTGPVTFARLPHVRTLEDVDVALLGVPFDTGVTYRVGGRFGPGAVRDASAMLRPYNPNLEIAPFEHLSCVDYGDVAIVPGYTERSYAAIESAVGPDRRGRRHPAADRRRPRLHAAAPARRPARGARSR